MPEQDPLRARFAAYRGDLTDRIDGPGPDAARRTLRRRRRATVATAALAVALVVAPIAAVAALRDAAPPGPPASTPTAGPTSSPSPEPSPDASRSPSSPPAPTAPDGRITGRQLRAAALDLPAWAGRSCADTTRVTLLPAATTEVDRPYLISVTHGDVDADGATETLALLGCRIGEASAKQVVAFDRDAAGRIVTLGRVARTHEEAAGGFEDVRAVAVAGGKVRVEVADIQPCCSVPAYWARQQWRTYGWEGERFTQTGGPTTWGRDSRLTDLAVTAGPLVLEPPDQLGRRRGTVTVTVTNRGTVDADRVAFHELERVGTPDGGDWDRCEPARGRSDWPPCLTDGVPAGERRSWTFRFRVEPEGPGADVSARVVHHSADHRYWPDLAPGDNQIDLRVDG
ncbi:hypothetical protein ABT235_03850 [Micromonospora echinofusca]|uniref:hypothetical protein n=1 Tax=Micromonospora echinofusca TaxID=47858 RepID=UPI000C702A90